MQKVAMETRVFCCVGCVRDPPFCPDPVPLWRHTFPGGFHIQHLPCLPTPDPPTPKELLGWLFSIKAIHTHLLRGSEVIIQEGTHHDLCRSQAFIAFLYSISKEKMFILTLTEKEKKTFLSSCFKYHRRILRQNRILF